MSEKSKTTIGRVDRVDFPDLQLFDIACKTDTGATTSAIHCHSIKLVERDGKDHLKVRFLDPKHVLYNEQYVEFEDYSEKDVTPTTGVSQRRYVIKTTVILFGRIHKIELTLADREKMKYPVLLGRTFLSKKFLVDVSKSNLSHKKKCEMIIQQAKAKESNEDDHTF